MNRRVLGVALAALLLTIGVACGSGSDDNQAVSVPPTLPPTPATVREATPVLPVTVQDKDGKSVTVKDVSRIIPLNGDIAEVVWALGLGEKVVGTDTSATYPEQAKALQKVGYQRTLSAEGILSLNPTVIIGNENAGPPEVIEQIRSIGVPVVIIKSTTSIDEIGAKIRTVAKALGVPNRGEETAKKTETEIADARALAAKATSNPKVMFLYLRGATVQQIMGKGSGADSLIVTAKATDVGAESGIQGSKPITPEALVAAQPDVFLVLTAGLSSVGGVDGLVGIPGIAQTPAGKAKRVIDMDDQYLLGLGPRAGQALMELVKKLHPELS
jgi:iron complex transport system substrate-binding protein